MAEEKLNYFQKIVQYRRYFIIEPYYFFYVMASVFNSIAMLNFPLEKACHVNLGYSQQVCAAILDKSQYNINCDDFEMIFENLTEFTASVEETTLTNWSTSLNYTVCKAELGAQKLFANVSGRRAPIAAIFTIIIVLFAGGWSDRFNKRKACMIVPLIGESLGFLCLLISSIFFDDIPMEFGSYAELIVPAAFGGLTLSIMAIDSYMTISTPEPDRVFRFGIFAMFTTAIPFVGQPVSGHLFEYLGYTKSFGLAFGFNVIALLYVLFVIKEVQVLPNETSNKDNKIITQIHDNEAYDRDGLDTEQKARNNGNRDTLHGSSTLQKSKSLGLRDFFDPHLVIDCVKFPCTKRPHYGRFIIILLIISSFFLLAPVYGEADFLNRFAIKKFGWNGNDYSYYVTFNSACILAGTFISTAIFSKVLKLPETVLGIISSLTTAISRIMFASADNSRIFYGAGVMEMFFSLRGIAIKALGSSVVQGEELSRMFSIFVLCHPLGQFIFTPIYSTIYESTINSSPGTIFLVSAIFSIGNMLLFIVCYILLRLRNSRLKQQQQEEEEEEEAKTRSNANYEITRL